MDTQRLILFFVFSFSLLLLWDAWQKEVRPPAAVSTPPAAIPAPSTAGTKQLGEKATPVPAAIAPGEPSERLQVRTDNLVAEIDTRGGDLVYVELLRHKDTLDTSKNLVLLGPEHRYAAQSGLIGSDLPNHRTLFRAKGKEFVLEDGQDKLDVRLEAGAAGGVQVAKVLTFHRGSFRIDLTEEITNGTREPLATHAYFQLTRDGKAPAGDPHMVQTYTGMAVYTDQDKFQKISFSDVDKGKVSYPKTADNGWIAVVQHYFVAALLPQEKAAREFFTKKIGDDLYSAGVILPVGPVAPGAADRVAVTLYAGPQDQDALKAIAPGLQLVVDYGWLTIIAAPLFWVMKLFHGWLGNWGLAIILLTMVIKLIFFPLSAASYRSMAKMKLVTPRLMKIREQYAEDRLKMNQAMMDLYKTEKINPLGGCLPIVVQIPVFIALYWVLLESVELRQAPFYLWVRDLSVADPWYVLPSLMMLSMIVQTKMNPTPPDPVQAKVMMIMPFAFGVMFFFFPAGLVLYWLVNNILSILQQWQITRMLGGAKTSGGVKR
ncbi:MAG TPA: membrane protein insertase YidC [Burkholderiales bacterium]|jgi:YidC/Oxa1 family membrane protein insertase